MKLKDLLVQELPKRGGWPDGVRNIEMFASGMIFFDGDCAPKEFNLPQCSDGWEKGMGSNYTNAVTREQYEAALAAVQKPVWNGEGLPPVGCECEVQYWNDGLNEKVIILAYHGDEAWVKFSECKGKTALIGNPQFRPIRSESDKKRDAIIDALAYYTSDSDAIDIYDAIAAGKIPGVKLDV